MEIQRTKTTSRQSNAYSFADYDSDRVEQERLNAILAANAEISLEKLMYRTHQEEIEAASMKRPIAIKNAFAYFGLMLGTLPPAAICFRMFNRGNEEIGLLLLLLLVNLICAVVGFYSGKLIGKIVWELEKHSWNLMLPMLPFVGALWGIITGGAGGVLIFVIGAFFGAILAAMVGSVAVPAFTIAHRLLKKGEMIERNQFLPLAFGITFIISAFIIGL